MDPTIKLYLLFDRSSKRVVFLLNSTPPPSTLFLIAIALIRLLRLSFKFLSLSLSLKA